MLEVREERKKSSDGTLLQVEGRGKKKTEGQAEEEKEGKIPAAEMSPAGDVAVATRWLSLSQTQCEASGRVAAKEEKSH